MTQQETNPNVPQKAAKTMVDALEHPRTKERFEAVLKENAPAFMASIIDLYNGDNTLQNCQPKQVVYEAMKAATLKLPVNKGLGFAYIVPYRTKNGYMATMQIGYRGYIQMAMRTGQYRIINADLVYEGELDRKNKLTGEISFAGDRESDKVVGYFAHFELINGFAKTLYMTKDDIIRHAKKYSKSYSDKNSAWQTDFDAMAKKTVIRNLLSHYGFLTPDMASAINDDLGPDTQQRDEQVKGKTGSKPLNIEDTPYEDVPGDNGHDAPEKEGDQPQRKPSF